MYMYTQIQYIANPSWRFNTYTMNLFESIYSRVSDIQKHYYQVGFIYLFVVIPIRVVLFE